MDWTDGPLCCVLNSGGRMVAQCIKQYTGGWAGFDLTVQESQAALIGNYSNVEEAKEGVEKYMLEKLG